MKKKLTTLLFSLLLAVGWTSSVSAQALPQGGYAERLGLTFFTAPKDGGGIVNATKKATFVVANTSSESTSTTAPQHVSYAPLRANDMGAVPPKSYYDGLTYSWSNPDNGDFGNDVPSTEVAKDPYQIYELLRFVYMDKRFPGPYYNAYTSSGQREDPVYYGGIEGGWDIPFTSSSGPSYGPVGNITITASNYNASITSIKIYDDETNALLVNWDAETAVNNGDYYSESSGGTNYFYFNMPNGWSSDYGFGIYDLSTTDDPIWCGYFASGPTTAATLTISNSVLNGSTKVRVVIGAATDANGASSITVNNETWNLSTTVGEHSWTIQGPQVSASGTIPQDVLITVSNGNVDMKSITVTSNGTTLATWNAQNNGATLPNGWKCNRTLARENLGSIFSSDYYCYINSGGTIRIPASLFAGHNSVTVNVVARVDQNGNSGTLQINNDIRSFTINSTSQATASNTINFPAAVDENLYKPNLYNGQEGYTALIVSVKNDAQIWPEPSEYLGACEFTTKKQVIDYIAATIDSVQLLTDGLRIGEGEKIGTVFNCDGTYNKFFFLSKGRARKKSSGVLASIGLSQYPWPSYACEEVPFKFMFEQFSPTGGLEGDQIYDFYSEMIQGHTYPIVHDCASVIQNGHQFSMSGNTGETYYGMRGLNFFIPDYRLKYYTLQDTISQSSDGTYYIETVDGRDMNPYMSGEDKATATAFAQATYFAVWYAQYNPTYAPRVGLYLITLDAEAHPCAGYDEETNHYYEVTLNWTSSLNEMSGQNVPQTYTIYEIVYNEETGEDEYVFVATVQNETTYTLPCPPNYEQEDRGKTHTYVVTGTPTGVGTTAFVAWSNPDDVVIPGLKDFLALELDHAESDFKIAEEKNWYRNFLMVKNENETKALTTTNVNDGMHTFTLYRYENDDKNSQVKIADIEFVHPIAANATRAKYKVTYDKAGYEPQAIEPYNINKPATQNSPAINIQNAYERETMGIPDEGELSIKGSGDIIIWPNGYNVNFLSIRVTNGNGNTTTWTPTTNGGNLPNGWRLSPGCKWVEYNGAYYLEGLGYMYIPAGTSGNASVVIKAFGDGSTHAKVTVNDVEKSFPNGAANAEERDWTITAANRAPSRATNEVTFTAGTDVANASTITKNGVTITNTQTTGNNSFSYNPYRLYAGTVNISTTTGKITKIVFNGNSTNNPVSRLSTTTGSYTTSNNVGTWTGDASSVNFTASGQARCSSIVVTVSTDEGGETPSGEYILLNNVIDGSLYPTGSDIDNLVTAPWSVTNLRNQSGNVLYIRAGGSMVFTVPAGYSNSDFKFVFKTSSSYYNGYFTFTPSNGSAQTVNTSAANTEYECVIPGLSSGDVVTITGVYTGYTYSPDFMYMYVYVAENTPPTPSTQGMIRLAIPVVDQFNASTATNDHARKYTYELRYEPQGEDPKPSNPIDVFVQHTDSKVWGYYNTDSLDNDIDRHIETDVMTADVQFNLSKTETAVFYNTIQGKVNALPAEYKNYETVLQRLANGEVIKYQEMKSSSSNYLHQYDPGVHNYYDSIPTTGTPGQYKSYVPSITTMGHNRRYYDIDTLHNTYGAPIWKTGVGQVTIINGEGATEAQWQDGAQGSTHWTETVTTGEGDDAVTTTTACNLYFLGVEAKGYLPSSSVSNIKYEPHMFRVWIESPSNKLRGCSLIGEGVDPNKPGEHWEGDGTAYGSTPVLIYEGPVTANDLTDDGGYLLDINIDNDKPWSNNIWFGAVDGIDDLKVYVRFYFKSTGDHVSAQGNKGNRGLRDGEEEYEIPVYYATEDGAQPNPTTGIISVFDFSSKTIQSVTYVNAQGLKSNTPFDGVNIVITRYTDGTTRTTKVVR